MTLCADRCSRLFGLVLVSCILLLPPPVRAHDELFYISGQVGGSFPGFSDITFTGSYTPGSTAKEFDVNNSVLYGVKAGMYSKSGFLGLETEVFQTHPTFKQQRVFVNDPAGPTTDTFEGRTGRITTWAFNVVGRASVTDRLQAYAAVGPAIFFSHLRSNGFSQDSTRPGLNTQLGLNYFLLPNIAVFGEWKFNMARFHYDTAGNVNVPAHVAGFNADYTAHNVAFGITYYMDAPLPWQSPITIRKLLGL